MSNTIKETAQALRQSQSFIISGHSLPDGDSIGSLLALGLALKGMGKKVTMISEEPIPALYRFLPESQDIVLFSEVSGEFDTFIFVDCTDPSRAGEGLLSLMENKNVINIDHHVSNKLFGQLNLVDAKAAATGEIIYLLLEELKVPFTVEIARCLYTTLVMDTGSFQFSNTTPQTHRMAAGLMEVGIDAAWINQNLYDSQPLIKIRLLQKALASLVLSPSQKIAWVSLSQEEMDGLGANKEHVEGIIGYIKMIEGVEIALLFLEIAPGLVKVGLRSKELVDVNQLAGIFGGGGHAKAAGCRVNGALEQVIEKVVSAAEDAMEGV